MPTVERIVNPYESPRTGWENGARLLPAPLAAHIDTSLEPGEKIHREGRPAVLGPVFRMLCVAVVMLGAATVFAIWRDNIVFFIVSAILVIQSLLFAIANAVYRARNTAVALTNRRILVCSYSLFTNRCKSLAYLPEELAWQAPKAGAGSARSTFLHWLVDSVEFEALACRTLLPQLMRRLHDGDAEIRRRAAACLKHLGRALAPFTNDVAMALKSDDCIVRRRVAEALGRSGVGAAARYLERLRFDENRDVANTAIKALHRLSRL